jgi:hypothetical protein
MSGLENFSLSGAKRDAQSARRNPKADAESLFKPAAAEEPGEADGEDEASDGGAR